MVQTSRNRGWSRFAPAALGVLIGVLIWMTRPVDEIRRENRMVLETDPAEEPLRAEPALIATSLGAMPPVRHEEPQRRTPDEPNEPSVNTTPDAPTAHANSNVETLAPSFTLTPPARDETSRATPLAELFEPPLGWMEPIRRCHRGRRFFCDGPRRVPVPWGENVERAERLGLGTRRTYNVIMSGPAQPSLLREIPDPPEPTLLWPVPSGFMGRGFGYVRRGSLASRLHRGVDIPAPIGAPIRAVNPGIVIYSGNGVRGYGNLIVILHQDDTRSMYAHLREARVVGGQFVSRGEVIGEVGKTGLTRAPHLHFEWRLRAMPRDPTSRFAERPSRAEEIELMHEAADRREAASIRLEERRERARRNRDRAERARSATGNRFD